MITNLRNTMIVHGWIFHGCQWLSFYRSREFHQNSEDSRLDLLAHLARKIFWRLHRYAMLHLGALPRFNPIYKLNRGLFQLNRANHDVFVFGWRIRSSALSFLWVPSFLRRPAAKPDLPEPIPPKWSPVGSKCFVWSVLKLLFGERNSEAAFCTFLH